MPKTFDTRMILENAGETKQTIDWELIQSYLEIFDLKHKLGTLKNWDGTTN
jgi:hypothetical protein